MEPLYIHEITCVACEATMQAHGEDEQDALMGLLLDWPWCLNDEGKPLCPECAIEYYRERAEVNE